MTSLQRLPTFALALVANCAAAAGHPATQAATTHTTHTNDPASIAAVLSALTQAPAETAPPLVLVTPVPPVHGLTAFDPATGRRLWQTQEPIDARPWPAGDLVVSHARSEVVAWNATTGAERWRHPDYGLSLIGVGSDARFVAVSLGVGGLDHRNAAAVVIDRATGATRYEDTTERSLGTPAVAAGFAMFPWDGQNVSIVDGAQGFETARISDCEDFVSRVIRADHAVFFGGARLYRLTPEAASGRRASSQTYAFSRDDIPGRPHLVPSGYLASYAGVNARERTLLLVRPDPSRDGVHLVDDTVYLVFFRALIAFDATSGAVRWAHLHPADIVGAEVLHGGVVLVDATGSLVWLGAHAGNVLDHRALGIEAAQAAFQLPVETALPHEHSEPETSPEPGLAAVAAVDDARMVPVRVLAVRALASIPGAESTRALVAVASTPSTPDEVRDASGDALSQRTDGAHAMLEALDVHADYFRRTHAPPVGFLARALAHAHERRAVPQLVAHLQDPATPAADLAPIATALGELGDPAAIVPLSDFVVTYHADQGAVTPVGGGAAVDDETAAERDAIHAAVGAAAASWVTLAGANARHRVELLANEAGTLPAVRQAIEHALAPPSPPPAAHVASAAPVPAAPSGPPAVDRSTLPPRLTADMISHAFAPVRRELLACVPRNAPAAPVRIEFRYDGDGHVLNVVVRPDTLSQCMQPIVSRLQFPQTQVFREVRMYMLPAPGRPAPRRPPQHSRDYPL